MKGEEGWMGNERERETVSKSTEQRKKVLDLLAVPGKSGQTNDCFKSRIPGTGR